MLAKRSLVPVLLWASGCVSDPVAPRSNPPRERAVVQCLGEPQLKLSYGVDCHTAADCSTAWVPIDCCGTARAVGVARHDESRLARQLDDCPGKPSCECLAQSTLLDSGERIAGPEDIALACERGRCVTHSRSGVGQPNGDDEAPASGGSLQEDPKLRPWSERSATVSAAYTRLLPASDEEQQRAQVQALRAEPGQELDPSVTWALNEGRNSGVYLRAWCRQQVNYPQTSPLEHCTLEALGHGSVLLLTLTTECGGDACSTDAYVLSAVLGDFVKLPADVSAGAEASPGGEALFFSSLTDAALPSAADMGIHDPFGGNEAVILDRIELPSLKLQSFAPCFSPTLSPKGGWILCRDWAANVLKLPVTGGTPELVASSGLRSEDVYHVWYAYIWPQRVDFITDTRLQFSTVRSSGEVLQREVPWNE